MDLAAELAKITLPDAVRDAILAQSQLVTQQAELIARRDQKIQALTLELAHLRRMRFGRKAESLSADQHDLFQDSLSADIAAIEARLTEAQGGDDATPRGARERAGRQPLPAHLPRTEIRHEPEACTCTACQSPLVAIGEDVSEQLDYQPGTFRVIRHVRPQYACRRCVTVSAAAVAPSLIDGGLPTAGLLAWVMVSKYADHLPLYRISQIAARSEVDLARSTLASWVGTVGWWLQPLADRLAERLRAQTILHADETPVQQLDPGAGKTKRAYLWTYRSNDLAHGPPMVVFDYQGSRSGCHARHFLANWRGRLMVDDYGGYKSLFEKDVIELACWAHARRKFHEHWAATQSPTAAEALRQIAELYAIEATGRHLSVEARHILRSKETEPCLANFKQWLDEQILHAAPKGALARALGYTLKRWPALCRYAKTGDDPIDNNAAENAIRPVAIGKKNWLFAGSEASGKRAAAIQSLLGTARLNGLEPWAWLTDTLEKLPTWPNSSIDALLPLRLISEEPSIG